MTVRELIEHLNAIENKDLKVAAPGYEDGYNEITSVSNKQVYYDDSHEWWSGEFQDYDEDSDNDKGVQEVVYLL